MNHITLSVYNNYFVIKIILRIFVTLNLITINAMNRIFILFLFSLVTWGTVQAQRNNYIHLSGNAGVVINSERDKKFGIGGTVSWLAQDIFIAQNPANYISLTLKAFNN